MDWTSTDEIDWCEAVLDTPFRIRGQTGRTAEEAVKIPGNAVKSRELAGMFPEMHGILVKYPKINESTSGNTVMVRGYGSPVSPKAIWIGTTHDYHSLWEID